MKSLNYELPGDTHRPDAKLGKLVRFGQRARTAWLSGPIAGCRNSLRRERYLDLLRLRHWGGRNHQALARMRHPHIDRLDALRVELQEPS